jgi:mannose-6-phosphate isomerase-like protein (cupin superfamily)
LTSGVAEIELGGALVLHRHAPPEVYYILDGTRVVTLGEEARDVGPGAPVFIPGDTVHGFKNTGKSVLRFFYVFPVDSYCDVEYIMLG